jgi:hypothetical protein
MEDRAPVIGKPTAFLQTDESEKVQILGLQRMRQENNVVYTYRLLRVKMQILRSSQYKDMYGECEVTLWLVKQHAAMAYGE